MLAETPVALASVVAASGSTPRIAGARQILSASGESFGTIGGGATEARVLELARETLVDGCPRIFQADLRGRPDDIREGVCGGTMTIWIVRLNKERDFAIVDLLNQSLRAGKSATLTTRFEKENSLAVNSVENASGYDANSFSEVIEPAPRLLIVGAGHIGRALAWMSANLGFAVAIQDDRPEWITPNVFPPGCTLDLALQAAIERLSQWEGGRFVAVVSRGFMQDIEALDALAAISHLDYVGLLGSKIRVATVLSARRKAGRPELPGEVFHAPIGIEIGAETPEEIAVSIAAELIKIRRRNRG